MEVYTNKLVWRNPGETYSDWYYLKNDYLRMKLENNQWIVDILIPMYDFNGNPVGNLNYGYASIPININLNTNEDKAEYEWSPYAYFDLE